MNYPTELESTAIVRFQDCDPFGHLNNARFIDYFMNARVDQVLHAYGLRIIDPQRAINWVVRETQLAYLTPALLGEVVLIQTRLLHTTQRTLLIEAVMTDTTREHIKAVGWIQFMCVNMQTARPAIHTEDLQTLFDAVQISTDADDWHFADRVAELRTQNRQHRATPVA